MEVVVHLIVFMVTAWKETALLNVLIKMETDKENGLALLLLVKVSFISSFYLHAEASLTCSPVLNN